MQKISIFLSTLFFSFLFFTPLSGGEDNEAKELIDWLADTLKEKVDQWEEKEEEFSKFIQNYPWKGLVFDEVEAESVTFRDLRMNGYKRGIVVSPGDRIDLEFMYAIDKKKTSPISSYQVIIGIPNVGPIASVNKVVAPWKQKGIEETTITAPMEPGLYEVRLKLCSLFSEGDIKTEWYRGGIPSSSNTMGLILVR